MKAVFLVSNPLIWLHHGVTTQNKSGTFETTQFRSLFTERRFTLKKGSRRNGTLCFAFEQPNSDGGAEVFWAKPKGGPTFSHD